MTYIHGSAQAAQPGADVDRGRRADFVVALREVGASDIERAGGKGANLGELVRAGFPVPPGFVVTVAAYDRHLAGSGLAERIPALLEQSVDGAAVREALTSATVPSDVTAAVRGAYTNLGEGEVAVRSSATAEDLPQAAFAGQQETYLGVTGPDALLDAILRCWASLWTQRAISYRNRHGIAPSAARIAVVVQRMVPAASAGVLFTANPVSGARDEILIDANPGLGEAVVSGLVTPEHIVVDKRSGRVREVQAGRGELMVRSRPGGGTEHMIPSMAEGGSGTDAAREVGTALPHPARNRLVTLAVAIERHFDAPQDVEWAWTGEDVRILQARPITALPEPPERPGRVRRVVAPMLAEMLPVRPYPLDLTTWSAALIDAATTLVRFVGVTSPALDQMAVAEDSVVVRLDPPAPHPTPRIAVAPFRLLWRAWRYDSAAWASDPLLSRAETEVRALEGRTLADLPWRDVLATLREALAVLGHIGELRLRYLPRPVVALATLRVILALLGRGGRFWALLSGIETKTAEANAALEDLATDVRSDSALTRTLAASDAGDVLATLRTHPSGRRFLQELETFLDRYGHRETVTALLASQPTWKDAPEEVVEMVRGLAAAPPQPAGPSPGAAAYEDLCTHPLFRSRPARSAIRRLVAQARLAQQVREDTHFYATRPLPAVRRALLELGRRLTEVEVLDAPGDVFHLKLDELDRVGNTWPPPPGLRNQLRGAADRRKARRAALADTPFHPQLAGSGEIHGVVLRGGSGSRGVAQGPVRVIRDSSEFSRLRAGDVLVAPYTNPTWTPLFQRAAAVVVDSGGVGSHAAIVAREYGIPAVMGTAGATRRLTDGEIVRVDGAAGTVAYA